MGVQLPKVCLYGSRVRCFNNYFSYHLTLAVYRRSFASRSCSSTTVLGSVSCSSLISSLKRSAVEAA